jgi:hypothetical protein
LDGKQLFCKSIGFKDEGNYSFSLPESNNKVLIYSVRMGDDVQTIKLFNF